MDAEKIWTIPYIDQPISFWNELDLKYGNFIDEVYFPLPLDIVSSGRPLQPQQYLIQFLQECPFRLSVLVNPLIFQHPVETLTGPVIEKLQELFEEYQIYSATVSNLSLAQEIKKSIPLLKLNASVLMDIFASNQLEMIKDVFDILVPSSRIVRNLPALKALKKGFAGQIRLIVNEGCLPDCIFRVQHFYEMGAKLPYPQSLCQDLLQQKPWLRLTGSWILPQHLHFYEGVYDKLKLSGRVTLQHADYFREVFEAYLFRKPRFPGKIGAGPVCANLPFTIKDDFFKKTLYCHQQCESCSICREEYERLSRQ